MKRMITTAWAVLALCLALNAGADPIFVDNFANGIVADSDSQAGFWSTYINGTGSVSESNGAVTLVASAAYGVGANSSIYSGRDSRFNFFNSTGLTVSATVDTSGMVVQPGDESSLAFRVVMGIDTTKGLGNNCIYWQQTSNGGIGIYKVINGTQQTLRNATTTAQSMLKSYSLSLDATDYYLEVVLTDDTQVSYSGAHGLSDWGDTSILQGAVRFKNGGLVAANSISMVEISNLTVTPGIIPEPATMGMIGIASIVILAIRRMVMR